MSKQSDGKSPGFWFYTADYERDMQILSLSAQGLWSRMLCWMHDNEAHRGFAELPTGAPMAASDIAAKVGKSVREISKCIAEMERIGTFNRDDRGCIYCRRMARDTHISEVRKLAAMSRMDSAKRAEDGSFAGNFGGAKDPAKQEQNPTVTASVSDSVSDVLTHKQERVRPTPIASDFAAPPSGRFEEFWTQYPRKQRRDFAGSQWVSVVPVAAEAAVFGCLRRYLDSDEVARGIIANPDKWLYEQHRNQWKGDWPKARESPQSLKGVDAVKDLAMRNFERTGRIL